jgi:hypothetical protein
MARYSQDFIEQYKTRFPALYERVTAAETPAALTRIVRETVKAMDAGTLDIPACDGAIEVFKTVRREDFAAERGCSRSAADARADAVLYTGARANNGRRIARRMGGRR